MSHLSQNLEKLIQMISIEQLLGLVKQNTENKSTSDIMNLPIVQKVVQAYEDEIHKPLKNDYGDGIAKIHEQLASINNNLLQLTEAIRNINITSNKGSNLVAEVKVESSNVVTKSEEVAESSNVVYKSSNVEVVASLEEEHVRLKIEEKQDTKVEEESLEAEEEEEVLSKAESEAESLEEEEVTSEAEEETEVASLEADEEEVLSKAESEAEEETEVASLEADEEDESEKEISDEELEVEVSASETEADEVEEEDISETEEVFEIEIDDVTYYATSEENGILYEVDSDGEVGKKVGIIKDGEPIFV
jgi:hypothetical protein